ncbi:MAG TPA: hypothetical protein VGM38_03405 [Pseudolysinimonas sp.]|jgi:6-phospho-beta-glucosidase
MKLVLVGTGVRSPLFASAALRRASKIGLTELTLVDSDADRLKLFSSLVEEQSREAGSPVLVTHTTSAEEAFQGADHVVMTIRPGGEEGRVLDERIALKHGILGQETTGPGGFAMALRTVPAVLRYAEQLERISPGAWLYNFTNPAGLVTQALHDAGFSRVIGICDGANEAQKTVSEFLHVDQRELKASVVGLNHLSWALSVEHEGKEVLASLLENPEFLAFGDLRIFDSGLIKLLGTYPNAYLYYFYYAERAVEEILQSESTRGEEVRDITSTLLSEMRSASDPASALESFRAYHRRRGATYMAHAREHAGEQIKAVGSAEGWSPSDEEGYAGVMLDAVEAIETNTPLQTALNVPNAGATAEMADDDVLEISCLVDGSGVRTLPIPVIPPTALTLMRSVKEYERLTARAIAERSRSLAVEALMCHPLVLSYSRATALVDEYLEAHREYIHW